MPPSFDELASVPTRLIQSTICPMQESLRSLSGTAGAVPCALKAQLSSGCASRRSTRKLDCSTITSAPASFTIDARLFTIP